METETHRKLLVCVSGTRSETKIFSLLNFHGNEGMLLVYIVLLTSHNDVQDQKHNFELRKNDFMLIICHLQNKLMEHIHYIENQEVNN